MHYLSSSLSLLLGSLVATGASIPSPYKHIDFSNFTGSLANAPFSLDGGAAILTVNDNDPLESHLSALRINGLNDRATVPNTNINPDVMPDVTLMVGLKLTSLDSDRA